MAYEGGRSMDTPKKNRPNSKAKVTARKTARKESGMSAQKFYVKTRMAEAAKGGKTVNAKDLRKKFQSGEVTRKGFGAPKKSTGGTGTGTVSTVSTGSSRVSLGNSKSYDPSKKTPYKPMKPSGSKKYAK